MLWNRYRVDTFRATLFGKVAWKISGPRFFPFVWMCRVYSWLLSFDDGRQWNRFVVSKESGDKLVCVAISEPPRYPWEESHAQ